MGVEVRPFGVRCNLACTYCYQQPERDAGNVLGTYDLEAIEAGIDAEGSEFVLFGGEPLLLGRKDLERLFKKGLERFGRNGIQTNGTLITAEHVRLFKSYKVRVGISVDGPGELNDARWNATKERTRRATRRSEAAIRRLCEAGIPPALIITLHRLNAVGPALERLGDWLGELDALGVKSARLHLLEVEDEDVRDSLALSEEENLAALRHLTGVARGLPKLRIDLDTDIAAMLAGSDRRTSCVWNACDPYTTAAVRGIDGNGQRTNCGRTNKDGVDFVKAPQQGFERYLSLYHLPQSRGGCAGCRFFLQCKGQCPGTALHGDWRNRTEHCGTLKALFADAEGAALAAGEVPLSLSPHRKALEAAALATWAGGRNTSLQALLAGVTEDRTAATAPEPVYADPALDPSDEDLVVEHAYGMELYPDVRLPEWTRVAWVSDKAEKTWSPRLAAAQAAWSEIEWLSVAAGIRQAAVVTVGAGSLASLAAKLARQGLHALVLAGDSDEANPTVTIEVAVGAAGPLRDLLSAYEDADAAAIGRLLGHPPCCDTAHRAIWVDHGVEDTTWPAALAEGGAAADGAVVVSGAPVSNMLWRSLGLRAVPHISCRSDCAPTLSLAEAMLSLGREQGHGEAIEWLLQILSWPVEWSCLHGIAELKSPVLKVSYRTDVTGRRHVVRRLGDRFPEEGADGLRFPYRSQRSAGEARVDRSLPQPVVLRSPAARRARGAAGARGRSTPLAPIPFS